MVFIPPAHSTVIRFLVHLSTYCKNSTLINCLSAINVLHRHFGYNVALHDVFSIKPIIRGLRRILGDAQEQKLPITPDILSRPRPLLIARENSGFWAAMQIAFFSLFGTLNRYWSRSFENPVPQGHSRSPLGFVHLCSLVQDHSVQGT